MGVGIINAEGDSLTFLHADVLKVRRGAPRAERLHRLYTELLSYIARHKPDEIAIEEPFVARNARSAIAVGQAQAVAMIAAQASGISVQLFAPREVKLAVTGFGDSSKEQVQEMAMLALDLNSTPMSLDASDALAIAICHINARRVQSLIHDDRI
jgi:crossover junction endodeoxyribonuclease RuvC